MKPSTTRRSSVKRSFDGSMILEKLPGYFLLVCLFVSMYYMFEILKPFITVIFVGGVLAIAFYPMYKKFLKWFGGWSRVTSFFTCLIVIVIIVAPLTLFTLLLTSEAYDTYIIVQEKVDSGVFDKYLDLSQGGYLHNLAISIDEVVDLDSIDLKKDIVGVAEDLSTFLVSQTTSLVRGVSSLAMSLVVMLFVMYYFFKDGTALVKRFGALSPLPSAYESELFKKIQSMVKAIMLGVFVTAIAQGVVGGIGFTIAGISNPIFWGTAMAFLSLLPVVGTAVVWVPAVIIMIILGSYGSAIFIAIWGVLVIGSVDNFLRPYLIGGKAHTYPLMTFLVVLGGVVTMGLKGVIIGPLVLVILLSFLHIYEAEYKQVLKR